MSKFTRTACLTALVCALAAPALGKGSDLSPADLNALKSYTLSMDKVKAMEAAMNDVNKVPALKNSKGAASDSKSLAEMEAKINAMPQAMAIYRKHGLSAHDAVVMPFALMDAGMVVAYPSAAASLGDRVSPAQVAFYKQHQAELKKINWLFGGGE